MRFVGLLLVLLGAAVAYYIGYLGWSIDQVRTHLAQILNLPGLAPGAASSSGNQGQPMTGTPVIQGGGLFQLAQEAAAQAAAGAHNLVGAASANNPNLSNRLGGNKAVV